MNKSCLLSLFILALNCHTYAQVFPFDQGFHGILTYQLPAGWEGDITVQPYHGLNDEKGLAATIASTDRVDSVTTPWIGPLAANTEYIFWYRMVDDFIFPSTQRNLRKDDRLDLMLSTDSINYISIYTVDSFNHIPSTNFKKITFTNTNYGNQLVKLKFRAQHGGGGSYYVDIDSVKVREKFVVGIDDTEDVGFSFFPNPVKSGSPVYLDAQTVNVDEISIYNISGALISQKRKLSFPEMLYAPQTPGLYFIRYGNVVRKLTVH